MNHYIYDGSFEGLLSVVFEIYRRRAVPASIEPSRMHQPSLTGTAIEVETNESHAERVFRSLTKKADYKAACLYKAFLSETPQVEMILYQVIRIIFQADFERSMLDNYTEPSILKLHQLTKKIDREAHRMHAFVRFEKSEGGIYFSRIEPDFNVLPLIGEHFEKRYADQVWMIYDVKRKHGIYYDLETISWVTLADMEKGQEHKAAVAQDEDHYQKLWKAYFDSVSITERKNTKLHLQHLPKRYWKYLTEKQ